MNLEKIIESLLCQSKKEQEKNRENLNRPSKYGFRANQLNGTLNTYPQTSDRAMNNFMVNRSGHSTVKYIINEEEEEEKRKGVEMPDILSISSPETCMCENNSTIVRSSQF